MSAATMQGATEITGEIQQFFDAFAKDFSQFDGALIAQRYMAPYTVLNTEGRLHVFTSHEAIAQYFQGFLHQYRQQGCRLCSFKDLQVVPLGQMSALASVTWALLRSDHSIVSTWRESYNLMRSEGELRIYASTDHVELV